MCCGPFVCWVPLESLALPAGRQPSHAPTQAWLSGHSAAHTLAGSELACIARVSVPQARCSAGPPREGALHPSPLPLLPGEAAAVQRAVL